MANTILNAEKRDVLGRKVKTLRKDGILPANLFGNKIKSQSVQMKFIDFKKAFEEVGETGLLDIHISSKGSKKKDKRAVLVSNVQLDPVTDIPLHVDFHQVDLKQKVTAQVPVEVLGESPAEKQGLGTVITHFDEVEVEALPADLPEKFELDLTELKEVDQTITAKDLDYDKSKVELQIEPDAVIVKVEPLRKEEEEAPSVEVEGEESKAVEGEEDVVKEGEEEKSKDGEEAEAKGPEPVEGKKPQEKKKE